MSTVTGPGGTITYYEEGPPEFSGDGNSTRCKRVFRLTSYSQWENFVNVLMGCHAVTFNTSANTADVRLIAEPLPLPGWNNMFCESWTMGKYEDDSPGSSSGANVVGNSTYGGTAVTDYSGTPVITAFYAQRANAYTDVHPQGVDLLALSDSSQGPTNPENKKGTWLSYEADYGAEIMQTGWGYFHWVGATSGTNDYLVGENIHPGIVVPSIVHSITWNNCIAPPWKTIRTSVGKVNTNTTMFGAATGCLLFLGAQPRQRFRFQGGTRRSTQAGQESERPYYDITYRFAEQCKYNASSSTPVGWNYLYKRTALSGTDHWVLVEDADSLNLHQYTNFENLFKYGC